MNEELKDSFDYQNEEIKKIVDLETIAITQNMLKALIQGNIDKIGFKELASKHTLPNLEKDISTKDSKFQGVFHKLTLSSLEFIKTTIPPLEQSLARINIETNNPSSAGLFLGSFVFPKVDSVLEKFSKLDKKSEK